MCYKIYRTSIMTKEEITERDAKVQEIKERFPYQEVD